MYTASVAGKYNWMKVVDVMTAAPATIAPWETTDRAYRLMAEKGIRQLPVVEGDALVGIVTDRDLRLLMTADPLGRRVDKTRVGEIMTRDPLTLSPDDDLAKVVAALLDDKFGGFPVVESTPDW